MSHKSGVLFGRCPSGTKAQPSQSFQSAKLPAGERQVAAMESPNIMSASRLNLPCSMIALSLRALLSLILIMASGWASAQAVRVVAKVNGDAITDFALKQRITFAIKSAGMQD